MEMINEKMKLVEKERVVRLKERMDHCWKVVPSVCVCVCV